MLCCSQVEMLMQLLEPKASLIMSGVDAAFAPILFTAFLQVGGAAV
jgi:hypothetical protein